MKKVIFIFSVLLVFTFSTSAQDTPKFKVIKAYYGEVDEYSFNVKGELDGAVINTDTISLLMFPLIRVVNISNDTFSSDVRYEVVLDFFLYADTGLLLSDHNVSKRLSIGNKFLPNDTIGFGIIVFSLPSVINEIEMSGIALEQISYWKMIAGISYTSKDGMYSEEAFYAGADTSIFYVVRGGVGVVEPHNYADLQIYPNPTTGQLTIESTELKIERVEILDILVQCVFTTPNPSKGGESSTSAQFPSFGGAGVVIDVSHLASGAYFVTVYSEGQKIARKFVKE